MEIEFVHKLNIGELVGTQGLEGTQSALLQVDRANSEVWQHSEQYGPWFTGNTNFGTATESDLPRDEQDRAIDCSTNM